MSVEAAPVTLDPSPDAESAIQVGLVPEVWPPLATEDADWADDALIPPGGPHPPTPDADALLSRRFALFLVEGLAGVRPARQLLPWLSKRGSIHLNRLTPLFQCGQQPRVLRVLTARPGPGVMELTVIVRTGQRTRALAARLERAKHPDRWLCTDIEAG